MANTKKKKKGISSNAKLAIALLVELIVLVGMGVGYFFYYTNNKLDKIVHVELKKEDLAINEGANEAQKGFTTIALFGIDSRDMNSMMQGNRSDSIMIASINNDTKEVKIASVYRDSLFQVNDDGAVTTKVTNAYSYGGPELAVQTLNANLDLQIEDFMTVNFYALTLAIDDLGGVEINVREDELSVLNTCITEQVAMTGIYSDGVFTTGEQLLNGTQATAWARIRSTDMGDITRTERQRTVISKMVAKAKNAGLGTVDKIIDDVFPNIATSLDKSELYDLVKNIFSYKFGDTVGFPFSYEFVNHDSKGAIIVAADMATNVSALHKFLFGTDNYTPTQSVQNISDSIYYEIGVGQKEIDMNIFNPPD